LPKKIKITQVKSAIGYPEIQKITVRTLGLRKLGHSVIQDDTPQIRGMVYQVKHLLKVVEAKKGK